MPALKISYRSSLRAGLKTTLMAAALMEVAASYGARRRPLSGMRKLNARERANWLQDAACTVLKRIGMDVVADGDPPLHGLLVSNHLSYLDVLVYASLAPCVFVAKQEVRTWPVFGTFATMADTIYVDRERGAPNGGAAALMEEALAAGLPVVLFPEGTSGDGGRVLRFHSRFFEPAVRTNALVTAAAVGYSSSTSREAMLAYHGKDAFRSHLVRTLGQRNLQACVVFAATGKRYADRKQAARATHAEVEGLRGLLLEQPATKPPADTRRLDRAG